MVLMQTKYLNNDNAYENQNEKTRKIYSTSSLIYIIGKLLFSLYTMFSR